MVVLRGCRVTVRGRVAMGCNAMQCNGKRGDLLFRHCEARRECSSESWMPHETMLGGTTRSAVAATSHPSRALPKAGGQATHSRSWTLLFVSTGTGYLSIYCVHGTASNSGDISERAQPVPSVEVFPRRARPVCHLHFLLARHMRPRTATFEEQTAAAAVPSLGHGRRLPPSPAA